ncbi:hypothetical protein JTB14_004512 [Gonioctena quinquepunctata]|nr:hypothetical protein JTB14_004512 [Gonioctena quinquepunctata]
MSDKDKLVKCDSCRTIFHANENCTNLAASELRAVILQSRSLIFFCNECRMAFKKVPLLIRQMEDIKNDVTELKEYVKALKNENKVLKENLMKIESSETNFDMEEFMNEMEERKKRSNNIMILNINESNAVNRNDRIKDEKKRVKEVLAHADIALNEFKAIRMGKYDGRKIRPIKVILESNDAAVNILKKHHS